MTLLRKTPWNELESVQRQLNNIFDDSGAAAGNWLPAVDIRETKDALVVETELPGIEKKDVKVDVKDNVLTISGERQYAKDVSEEHAHRIERSYGSFTRSFSLPPNVDTVNVDATMKNGILEIRIPKAESAKPKSITIK